MKKGDSPVILVYPPDKLPDEAVYAISEFLHEMCRSFEQHYHRRITRHMNKLEREYSSGHGKIPDEDEPF